MFEGFNAKFRRITSCAAAIVIVMGLVTSSIMQVKAVTPAEATIAAALVSYVGASGVRLWRDGVGSAGTDTLDQMIDDMSVLWGKYKDDNGSVPTWANIDGVSIDSNKFLLDYDTAQTFQGFADWLSLHFSMTPNNTYLLSSHNSGEYSLFTIPSNERQGLELLNAGVWALPVEAGDNLIIESGRDPNSSNYYYTEYSVTLGSAYCFVLTGGSINRAYFVSDSTFVLTKSEIYPNQDRTETSTISPNSSAINNVSRPNDGSRFLFYSTFVTISKTSSFLAASNNFDGSTDPSGPASEMSYVILAGDPVGTNDGLFATIGNTISDLTYDLIRPLVDADTGATIEPGQSVVVDIGASSTADEDEIVGIVSDAYIAGTDDAVVPYAVAYPAPIAGVQDLYPQPGIATDVDNLGLPALGQALTTRFPFCIPWDVAALYKSFNATPVRPVFTIDVVPSSLKSRVGVSGDTSVTLDLGDPRYDTLISIIRWGCLGSFIFGLAYATKRIIWTTGG